jgi:hypothetical protein
MCVWCSKQHAPLPWFSGMSLKGNDPPFTTHTYMMICRITCEPSHALTICVTMRLVSARCLCVVCR